MKSKAVRLPCVVGNQSPFRFYKHLCPIPGTHMKAWRADGFVGWPQLVPLALHGGSTNSILERGLSEARKLIAKAMPNAIFRVMPVIRWTNPGMKYYGIALGVPYFKIYFFEQSDFRQFEDIAPSLWNRPIRYGYKDFIFRRKPK